MNDDGPPRDVNLPDGPLVWRNWHASQQEMPRDGAWEFVLYSDAWLIGGPVFRIGPFEIINTIPARIPAEMAPAVVVRVDNYLPPPKLPAMDRTNVETWLGLSLDDEIAVLLSLVFGARARGGGLTRQFEENADPRGLPVEYLHRPPAWTSPPENRFVLPGLLGAELSLDAAIPHLKRLPSIPAATAVALLRAARQYRDALWLGDSDPQMAWLLLVSAVESCASHHAMADNSPSEVLASAKPDLVAKLETAGGTRLVEDMAGDLAYLFGATSKFLRFITRFAPDPPTRRPAFSQVDWTQLRKAVNTVYSHRSKALHEGRPMPAPLCEPPHMFEGGVPSERPLGLGSAAGASVWEPKDLPMHLHIFAYVVRGTLLAWWRDISEHASAT